MITGVVFRQQAIRMRGVANQLVKINHSVEMPRRSDPFIDLLAVSFGVGAGMIEGRADERRDGGCKNTDAMRVGPRDNLRVRIGYSMHLLLLLGPRDRAVLRQHSEIVHTLEDDGIAHPGLSQNVMIEASKRVGPESV